ncbi:MAG: lamin tail domain-containing protein [Candidatus Nanosalina sp.]
MASDRLETVATAALLVVLFVVPTASQNVDYPDERVSRSPVISSETSMQIDVEIDSETASTARIERHNLVYQVRETPFRRIETLTTPRGTLKSLRTNNSRIYMVSTPYGDLKKGIKNGRRILEFQGLNRTRTAGTMERLRERMKDYRKRVRQEMLPDIDVQILRNRADDPSESIRIENNEGESIDLTGWKLLNSEGDRYTFEGLEIPAYGDVVVYAASSSEINSSRFNTSKQVYDTGIDWDQDEDEASLFNLRGIEVASDSY